MSTETQVRRKIKLRKPPKYCNIFYNNDKTTFDAVIHIFTSVFNYTIENAMEKANEIDKTGKSIVFIGTKETCGFKEDLVNKEIKKLGSTHNIHLLEHSVELYEDEEDA
jgi:ATP-dependent Clp protease adapter protein ClpS